MGRLQPLRGGLSELTPQQVEQFDADGVVLPLRAISPAAASAVVAEIEAAEVGAGQSGAQLFLNGHITYRWMHELVTLPKVLRMVSDLLGPNFYCWKSQLWIKEPQSGSFVGWHQDAA